LVAGITYLPDYISQEAHDQFLLVVDQHPWRPSVDHDVQVYGYSYNHKQRAAIHVGELPGWAVPLAQRLHHEGHIRSVPNQLVVNAYPPGAGIFEHIDQSVFGDTVISVSLGSMCTIRFSHEDSARCEEMVLEPRSLLVLSGESRWQWKHGIPPRASDVQEGREYQRTRRVSLTFRAIPAG
jgi:alkylated DNA repair dioxygenase AlkB